jgi:hypothetical protein
MRILGIDPGQNGALALLDTDSGALETFDVPTFTLPKSTGGKRTIIDTVQLANWVDGRSDRIDRAWIEQVSSSSQMGVASSFKFGMNYGLVIGVVVAHFIRLEYVTPAHWKRVLKVPADKDASRARATQIFPRHAAQWPLKKHADRAEASLIAHFGALQNGL